jgi:Mn2+/Fe2+ NRAMP family transporter
MIPKGFWKGFGPGLLWAASAIGVSHLVQSTRAGALAGFGLAGVILFALILKYPFFEFGPRYAAATGKSLVEGYKRIGGWAIWLFFILTAVSSVIVAAAIVSFTAFLLATMLGVDWPLVVSAAVVFGICALMLAVGRFKLLDRATKLILAALGISTLIAGFVAIPRADFSTVALIPDIGTVVSFAFILALAGWMPSALDISVWNSLWTLAKAKEEGESPSVKIALLDFNIGYIGTSILAFGFLLLGAAVMFGSGTQFSAAGTGFSVQLVDLYSATLGEWLRPVIMVAVFSTMFSTSLTVLDGYPRALDRCIQNIQHKEMGPDSSIGRTYWIAMGILGVTTILILWLFIGNLTGMVDFATTFTFLTAPILGWLNLRVVTSDDVPDEHKPGKKLVVWAYVGILLLGGTAVVFIASLF